MKVVRVHGWGETPRVEDADAPEPTDGRTIVQMQAATVGHIDRTIWGGGFLRHPPLPYVPGVEAAGIVRGQRPFQCRRARLDARLWLGNPRRRNVA